MPADSGTAMLNGPAARLVSQGDEVIILNRGDVEDRRAWQIKHGVVVTDGDNRPCQAPEVAS